MKDPREMALLATKELMKKGLIVRAGWVGYEMACVPKDAGFAQRRDLEVAFYAGALHLFTSILAGLDETTVDEEPTEEDMEKMENVRKELNDFESRLKVLFPELNK